MSIFIDQNTRVLVQGITGGEGSFWTKHMIEMGTHVVAGVTPGKKGQKIENVPVFNTVREAVNEFEIDASVLFVPPRFAKDAFFESFEAGIKKMVVTAEGVPVHDALEMRNAGLKGGVIAIGPNTTGAVTPSVAMMGFIPYWIERVYKPGRIGIMTRSGSLTNEVTAMVVKAGFGVSTLVGIGGDAIPLTRFAEVLPLFEADDATDAVVIIGELGGTMEEEVACAIEDYIFTKPLAAFIAGRMAPSGKKMGHAGAIVSGSKGTAAAKTEAMTKAGALVADRPSRIGELLHRLLD